MRVTELLDLAGQLRSAGRPFSRPVLMAAFQEEDRERRALLWMAYRLYYANDHYRGDLCVRLAGYEDAGIVGASGPPDRVINTAHRCLAWISPPAPVFPTTVETPADTQAPEVTPTGLPGGWRIAFCVARAGSVMMANGMVKVGDLFCDMARKLVVGRTDEARELCDQIASVMSEAARVTVAEDVLKRRLEHIAENLGRKPEELVRAVKEVRTAIERTVNVAAADLYQLTVNLSNTMHQTPITHPKTNEYLHRPIRRYIPESPVTEFEHPPTDPDKVGEWIEGLKDRRNIVEVPYPLGGFYGVEHGYGGSIVDLGHWLIGLWRSRDVPAAAVVKHDGEELKLGVRYWTESASHVVWLYPEVEVEEPKFSTPDGVDPRLVKDILWEGPVFPF